MYAGIILKSKTRMVDRIYTYKIPDYFRKHELIGSRVIVPFGEGNIKKLGLIVSLSDEPNYEYVKEIDTLIDEFPIVDKESIEIGFFLVKKYLSDISSAFQTIMPPGDWSLVKEYFWNNQGEIEDYNKNELFDYLRIKRDWESIKNQFSNKYTHSMLIEYSNKGAIEHSYDINGNMEIKHRRILKISNQPYKLKSNANKQRQVIQCLIDNGEMEYSELLKVTNSSSSTVNSLIKKKIIVERNIPLYSAVVSNTIRKYEKLTLNENQKNVYDEILKETYGKFIIHGVTGSGKTEIYLQLVEENLKNGKDSIVLVPEISLTPQTIARFAGRFGENVAVLHSKLSLRERFDQWKQIKSGKYKIVVGARSAIFAPFKDLGLIIIDEEHELSYISEKHPKYDAIEVAEFRSAQKNATLVLGSATPRIDHYYKGEMGEYKILSIDKRATENQLPQIIVTDMREELKNGNVSMFCQELQDDIRDRLRKRQQIILFLNKRGHTSFVFCRRCGYVMKCDFCDIGMTYHKSKNRLLCHMCGRTANRPIKCPNCGSKAIKDFGAGTEKLEEETKLLFPDARVYRIDGDTVGDKNVYNDLYTKMQNNEVDILIGTQMISKGLDFPNVTLVGIISADISLSMGDYRASERTFQLLTQVAGRAGRGDISGKVIIQTYKPDHFSIQTAKDNDFMSFYSMEIRNREFYKYPPFYQILNIKTMHSNRIYCRQRAFEFMKHILFRLKQEGIKEFTSIGPNPSPIERINNMFRFDIYIKFDYGNEKIVEIVNDVVNENKYNLNNKGFRYQVTFDPINYF